MVRAIIGMATGRVRHGYCLPASLLVGYSFKKSPQIFLILVGTREYFKEDIL